MALVMETFNSASIGLSRLHFAKMTDKGSAIAYPQYDPFVRIDGLVSGSITPEGEIVADFSDNRTHELALNYSAAGISLEVTGLGPAGYEYVTGRIVSQDGGTVMMAGQNAPNLATAFEVLNGQRKRVRYVVYDCLFLEGEISLQTKGDGIEFSHTALEGQIADLLYEGSIMKLSDGSEVTADGIRFMTMTEGGQDYEENKWNNWFTTVQFPSGGTAVAAEAFEAFSFEAGSSAGESDLTIVSSVADSFVYVIGERNKPLVGTPISGGTVIATGGTIAGLTAGDVVSVYGLDALGKAKSFGTHVMLSSEIGT